MSHIENAASKMVSYEVCIKYWTSHIRTDHSFLVLIKMGSIKSSKCINVPNLKNAAVKWFHMRCAYSIGGVLYRELTIHSCTY